MRAASIIFFIVLSCLFSFLSAQRYDWPLYPVLEPYCRGTFCEYRSGPPGHFHEGIDIPATSIGYTIYSTTDTFCYIGSDWNADDHYIVTVQHYTQSGDYQTPLDEGSRYIHMDEIEPLSSWTVYIGQPIAEDITLHDVHLHFEMRWPAPLGVSGLENIFNPYNPFIKDNLCPEDTGSSALVPVLEYLYADGSTLHQGDASIECWNFLDDDFSDYYNSTAADPFIRLTLSQTETRDNDLDDPHILIGDHCKVRFILKAKDRVSIGYSENCAPYWLSLCLDTALAPGDEEEPITDGCLPFYEVKFEYLENEFDENETYDEEDVYHTSSPLTSDQSTFYYRLYPIDVNNDGVPGCILRGWTVLETEDLEEGQHRIRIVAKDYYGNTMTADAHFYKRTDDWVDYCRVFYY